MTKTASYTFKRFRLIRLVDVTGISSTGEIAIGVQWPGPDHACTLYWLKYGTTGNYKSIEQLEKIHCYENNAHIEWIKEHDEKETATEETKKETSGHHFTAATAHFPKNA